MTTYKLTYRESSSLPLSHQPLLKYLAIHWCERHSSSFLRAPMRIRNEINTNSSMNTQLYKYHSQWKGHYKLPMVGTSWIWHDKQQLGICHNKLILQVDRALHLNLFRCWWLWCKSHLSSSTKLLRSFQIRIVFPSFVLPHTMFQDILRCRSCLDSWGLGMVPIWLRLWRMLKGQ